VNRAISIQQPNYLPWLGYFQLMRSSDVWVWLDDVQYTTNDWRNRNRIARDGRPLWLTVPVRTRGRFGQRIADAEIDYHRDWVAKHVATVRQWYADAPYAGVALELVESAIEARPARLADLVVPLCEQIAARIGIRPAFVRSSSLAGIEGTGQERVLAICRRFDCGVYLSGPRGRNYIDAAAFAREGYSVRYAVYDLPPYARGPYPFLERLSVLDALAWTGADGVRDLLDASRRFEPA
jgi:hypothetical protein